MPAIDSLVAELKRLEQGYRPNDRICKQLSQKTLVLLVGPVGIGKSSIMNNVTLEDPRFARISGLTTRQPRPNDESDMYRYIPHTETALKKLLEKVRARELVQFAVHPTTGYIYGTEIDDYPDEYNCKDVFGHAVQVFRELPAQASRTFSLVCEPEQWQERRLNGRFLSANDPDHRKRMKEAEINLTWSLQDSETIWICNNDGLLGDAVEQIIRFATSQQSPPRAQQAKLQTLARRMLESIA